MIYLAKDGIYIKIGYAQSSNLHRRWMELQIGNPRELEFRIYDEDASMEQEQLLHKKFNNQHFRGEWFIINDELENMWNVSRVENHNKILGRPKIILTQAVEWLDSIMKDGPILATEARKKATLSGFSSKTITRAAKELKIQRKQNGLSNTIVWFRDL